MECNATSIKPGGRRKAYTLVELLIVVAIGGILMASLAQLMVFTGRSFAALLNYIELDRYSRNALDQMVWKIRQCDQLTAYSTNRLQFSYSGTNTLIYEYSSNAKTLTETDAGTSKILLRGCSSLGFAIFQRNTAAGTYDQFPATMTNSAAKLVQMSWTCSRSVLGGLVNSESVQSAKIVIRNQ